MTRRRKHAAIRISDKARELPEHKFKQGLLHELVHIMFDEVDFVSMKCIRSKADYEEARERAVDHISKALYTSMFQ